ncbi:MAG: cytochrome c [Anaerolineae bacterium]|nr:cytochrome c [Anaerolineae bacterium]
MAAWLLAACGSTPTPAPTPTLPPELALGKRVFEAHCAACHSLAPDVTLVGPSLAGIAQRGATRVDGLDARGYLYTSILRPGAYLVPGFQDLMPSTLGKALSGEELDAVVAFLLAQP